MSSSHMAVIIDYSCHRHIWQLSLITDVIVTYGSYQWLLMSSSHMAVIIDYWCHRHIWQLSMITDVIVTYGSYHWLLMSSSHMAVINDYWCHRHIWQLSLITDVIVTYGSYQWLLMSSSHMAVIIDYWCHRHIWQLSLITDVIVTYGSYQWLLMSDGVISLTCSLHKKQDYLNNKALNNLLCAISPILNVAVAYGSKNTLGQFHISGFLWECHSTGENAFPQVRIHFHRWETRLLTVGTMNF